MTRFKNIAKLNSFEHVLDVRLRKNTCYTFSENI
jgi:hypothetical protein